MNGTVDPLVFIQKGENIVLSKEKRISKTNKNE